MVRRMGRKRLVINYPILKIITIILVIVGIYTFIQSDKYTLWKEYGNFKLDGQKEAQFTNQFSEFFDVSFKAASGASPLVSFQEKNDCSILELQQNAVRCMTNPGSQEETEFILGPKGLYVGGKPNGESYTNLMDNAKIRNVNFNTNNCENFFLWDSNGESAIIVYEGDRVFCKVKNYASPVWTIYGGSCSYLLGKDFTDDCTGKELKRGETYSVKTYDPDFEYETGTIGDKAVVDSTIEIVGLEPNLWQSHNAIANGQWSLLAGTSNCVVGSDTQGQTVIDKLKTVEIENFDRVRTDFGYVEDAKKSIPESEKPAVAEWLENPEGNPPTIEQPTSVFTKIPFSNTVGGITIKSATNEVVAIKLGEQLNFPHHYEQYDFILDTVEDYKGYLAQCKPKDGLYGFVKVADRNLPSNFDGECLVVQDSTYPFITVDTVPNGKTFCCVPEECKWKNTATEIYSCDTSSHTCEIESTIAPEDKPECITNQKCDALDYYSTLVDGKGESVDYSCIDGTCVGKRTILACNPEDTYSGGQCCKNRGNGWELLQGDLCIPAGRIDCKLRGADACCLETVGQEKYSFQECSGTLTCCGSSDDGLGICRESCEPAEMSIWDQATQFLKDLFGISLEVAKWILIILLVIGAIWLIKVIFPGVSVPGVRGPVVRNPNLLTGTSGAEGGWLELDSSGRILPGQGVKEGVNIFQIK